MASYNNVHIEGTVKRDAEFSSPRNGVELLGFTLTVRDPTNDNLDIYVDCFAGTDVTKKLEGYVNEGERLAVDGHLTFRTATDHKGRKRSALMVYVDDVKEIEG